MTAFAFQTTVQVEHETGPVGEWCQASTGTVSVGGATVCYEIVGAAGAPPVAVLGGISASKHVTSSALDKRPGWWEAVVGPGRAIDTNQYRVIAFDYLRHAFASDSVTTNDQAAALRAVLEDAGIERLHAVVGASYGGMVALAFGADWPSYARRLIVISAAHQSDPMATALRHLQRRVVALGAEVGRERDALAIARGIAITTYLTPRYLEDSLGPDVADARTIERQIGSYLLNRGDQFAAEWTSDRYNALSLSLDLHSVRPEDISVPTAVIAISSDRLVPIDTARELARRLGGPNQLIELDSSLGHDAFLGDATRLTPFITELLRVNVEVTS
jgi:homoserine O-acetyltransferase